MLNLDPAKRLTSRRLLHHNWFNNLPINATNPTTHKN